MSGWICDGCGAAEGRRHDPYCGGERCPVGGGSHEGYCRCIEPAGHDGPHRCQHEVWSR